MCRPITPLTSENETDAEEDNDMDTEEGNDMEDETETEREYDEPEVYTVEETDTETERSPTSTEEDKEDDEDKEDEEATEETETAGAETEEEGRDNQNTIGRPRTRTTRARRRIRTSTDTHSSENGLQPEVMALMGTTSMVGKGQSLEGMAYKVSVSFPIDYPIEPPKVKFKTLCFHPNVDLYGSVCWDILQGITSMVGKGQSLEGMAYKVSVSFPIAYPIEPPKVKFKTSCFHPNVDLYGSVCWDILQAALPMISIGWASAFASPPLLALAIIAGSETVTLAT
ncbi:uncharacterized protein LOC143893046 isoform X2 [Tasmannia lanceolata]|uniref:uncharacterized protein LOC143893046 isoform X2 n=1 Tax=Tasmannia lanceolata TaxID=3420 RepID=UPI004062D988